MLYDLKVKDVIEIDESDRLMSKIGEYAIANVGDAIDEVVLADVLTVDTGADSFELMAYMVYGINDVTPVQSPAYIEIDGVQVEYRYTATYHYLYEEGGDIKTQECDAYVAVDSEGVISAVYYALAEGRYGECGTRLNDVSTRIDGLMNDLTIGELIEIDEDNTILNAISGATISTARRNYKCAQHTRAVCQRYLRRRNAVRSYRIGHSRGGRNRVRFFVPVLLL